MCGLDLLLGAWLLGSIGLSGIGTFAMAKGAYDIATGKIQISESDWDELD